jgi:hypothetical protein
MDDLIRLVVMRAAGTLNTDSSASQYIAAPSGRAHSGNLKLAIFGIGRSRASRVAAVDRCPIVGALGKLRAIAPGADAGDGVQRHCDPSKKIAANFPLAVG